MTTALPNVVNVSKMSLTPLRPAQTISLPKDSKFKSVSVSPAAQREFILSSLLPRLIQAKPMHPCRLDETLFSNPAFPVAFDLHKKAKNEAGKEKVVKTYAAYDSPFDFVNTFRRQRNSYEILTNVSVSPFLDLERDCSTAEEVQTLLARVPPTVEAALAKVLRQPVQVQWWTSSSLSEKKFSLHALVRGVKCSIKCAKAIAFLVAADMGSLGSLVGRKAYFADEKEISSVVDRKIYNRNRVFRLPLCSKWGKTRVKLPAEFNTANLFSDTGLCVLRKVLDGEELTETKVEILLGQMLYASTVAFSAREWRNIEFELELVEAAGLKREASCIQSEGCTDEEYRQGLAMWKSFEAAEPTFSSCLEVEEIGRCSKNGGTSWVQVKLRRVGGCRGCICARPLNGGHDSQGGFLSIWSNMLSFTCWGSHAKECNHFNVCPWYGGHTVKRVAVEDEPTNEKGFFSSLPEGYEYATDEEDDEEIDIYDDDECGGETVVEAEKIDEAENNSLIGCLHEVGAIEKKTTPTSCKPSFHDKVVDAEDWLAVYLVPDESAYVKLPDLVDRINTHFEGVAPEVRRFKPAGSRSKDLPSLTEVIEKRRKVGRKKIDGKSVAVLHGFSLLPERLHEVGAIEKKITPTSCKRDEKKKPFVLPVVSDQEVYREEASVIIRDFKDWADLASVGKAICLSSPMGAGKTKLLLEGCRGRNAIIFAYRCELAQEYYTECVKAGLNVWLYSHTRGRISMPTDSPAVLVITPDSIARLNPDNGWKANHVVLDEFTFLCNSMGGFIPKKTLACLEKGGFVENPTELVWDMVRKADSVIFSDAMVTSAHLNIARKHRKDVAPVIMDRKGVKAVCRYIAEINKLCRLLEEKLAEEVAAGRSLSFSSNTKKILIELFEKYKDKKFTVNIEGEQKEETIRVCLITADGFQTNSIFSPLTYKEAAGWAQLLLTSPKISAGNSYINGEGASIYKVHFGVASPQSTPAEDFVQSLARNRSIEEVYVTVTNRPACGQALPNWVKNIDQVKKWAIDEKEDLSKFGIKYSRFDGEILNGEQADMTFLYMLRRHNSRTKEKYLNVMIPLMKRNGMEIKEVIAEEEGEKVNLKEQRETRIRHEVEKLTEVNIGISTPASIAALKIAKIAGQMKAGKVSPCSEEQLTGCSGEHRLSKGLAEKAVREQWLRKKRVLDEILAEPVPDNERPSADKTQLVTHFEALARIQNIQDDEERTQALEEAKKKGWLKKPEEIKGILTRLNQKQNSPDNRHLLKQLRTLDVIQNSEHIKNIHSARQCLPPDFDVNRALGAVLDLNNFTASQGDNKKAALFFKTAGLKVEPETGKVVGNIWQIVQSEEQPAC